MRLYFIFLYAAAVAFAAACASAGVPPIVSYQGCLTDSLGNPMPDGDYTLSLTIYSGSTGDNGIWWCREHVVHVSDGMFTTGIGSICDLNDVMFSEYDSLWLGISISGGDEMSPRTPFTSAAYAFHSLRADTAGYITGGSGGGWADDGPVVRLSTAADSVGIGTVSPVAKLDVDGDINAGKTYQIAGATVLSNEGSHNIFVGGMAGEFNTGTANTLIGSGAGRNNKGASNIMIGKSAGYYNETGDNNIFVGEVAGYNNNTGSDNTFLGRYAGHANTTESHNTYVGAGAGSVAHGDSNTYLGASAGGLSSGSNNVFIGFMAGYNEDGSNRFYIANSSTSTPLIYGRFDLGTVGLGTTTPSATLHAVNGSGTAIRGEGTGLGVSSIRGSTSSTMANGVYGDASGAFGIGVRGYSTGSSGKGVYGTASQDSSYGVYGIVDGNSSHGVYGEAGGPNGHGVHAVNTYWAGQAIYASASGLGGIGIEAHAGDGGLAAKFFGNVMLLSPDDSAVVLELGEGLDYAEGFDASEASCIEPGSVMIIDPDNPGKLRISTEEYDTRVAGIVAGADGLGSGVRLGGDGYDLDVALAGRVYCKVDATRYSIHPGDMLTTSSIPGYAMKAVDASRSHGAILGKAMEPLEKGTTGKILVLVSLQ